MNGAHDLGGKHGYGPVDRSQTKDFEHIWEERVFGLTLTCGMLGHWNLDQSRFARERTDPVHYLSSTYYEHWLHGLETLLVEKDLITLEELKNKKSLTGDLPGNSSGTAVTPDKVRRIVETGAPTLLPDANAARFTLNESVVVKNHNPKHHTRAPSYVHGVAGTIVKLHGSHIYADEHSRSGNKVPEHLYSVRFASEAIWGDSAEKNSYVYIDLFEPYLLSLKEYQQSLPAS